MKEKSKKFISIAIVLFMVLNYFVPVINYAEDNTKEGKEQQTETEEISREYEIKETEEWDISENGDKSVIAKWNLADKSITISGKGNMKNWYFGDIEDWHKKYQTFIEKVVINNGIINIGDCAFKECIKLKEIVIPESITSIGDYAFYSCFNLKDVNIPEGVSSIGEGAFLVSTENINVSNNNKDFTSVDGVLYNKNKTELITYPSQKKDEKYSILNTVISIKENAFYWCRSLKEIIIPSGIISIEENTFKGCSSLKEITIPNGVTSIGNSAFSGCCSLKELTIPDTVTSIESWAFYGCNSLEKITIPNSVTSLDYQTFDGIKYITCKTNSYAHKYAEENEICYTLSDNIVSQYSDLYEIKETEEWDISENEDRSVIAKWNLTDKSITISGKGNMKDCNGNYNTNDYYMKYKKLTEKVIINSGINNIGDFAFFTFSSLREITISESVTSIGDNAFCGCFSLKEINIPEGVSSIGKGAFLASTENINVSNNNKDYTSVDGVLYNKNKTKLITYPSQKKDEKYSIIDTITSIEDFAFAGCKYLKEIQIPEKVTNIGEGTFGLCVNLEEIKIPEKVTSIGNDAFFLCYNLKEIIIPNGVTDIGDMAFAELVDLMLEAPETLYEFGIYGIDIYSSSMKAIIPESVTSIGDDAFWGIEYIACKTNSYAHKYAEENNVPYILDNNPPKVEINYSAKELTNKNVIATITANEELQEVVGWTLSEDKKTLTREYEQNAEEEIIVKDLIGNEVKQRIKVDNIVKATGDVTKDGGVNIGDLLKLKQHMAQKQSETTRAKHPDWKLDEEKILIGDVNKNGKIDVGDILKLQRYIAATKSKEIAERHSDWLNL